MRIIDYTCSRCGRDHALPPEQCPFVGYAPCPVTRGPTPEERHAQEQALQEKHAAENRERQQEADRLERQKTLERAKIEDMIRRVHEEEAGARAEKSAQVKAAVAEARAWMARRAQSGRLERTLATREQAQAKRRAGQGGGEGKRGQS